MSSDWIDELSRTWTELDGPPETEAAHAPTTADGVDEGVRRRARLQMLRFWGTLAAELLIGLVAMGYGAGIAVRGEIAAGLVLVVAMLATLFVSLWNRRGQWRVADASPAAFLELEVSRARGRLRAARIGWGVLVVVVGYVGVTLWMAPDAARGRARAVGAGDALLQRPVVGAGATRPSRTVAQSGAARRGRRRQAGELGEQPRKLAQRPDWSPLSSRRTAD